MDQQHRAYNPGILWGMILIAVAYGILIKWIRTMTGNPTLDGAIGVFLGLYICSYPAANLVNMILFERGTMMRSLSKWSVLVWLILNVTVLFAGWMVISSGAMQFIMTPR